MMQVTPSSRSSRVLSNSISNNSSDCPDLDDIDLESLDRVFGSSSPEELSKRKAHELRELWLHKNEEYDGTSSPSNVPRFLLDPENKDHVAPHVVALQLLLGRSRRRKSSNGDGLYQRVNRSEDSNNSHDSRNVTHSQQHIKPISATFGIILHGTAIAVAITSLACQFVLEVLGGAGAIWGCAELVRLRKGGIDHPSWNFFTKLALAVGFCCLLRFLLVHPFFNRSTDPTFAEKHKLRDLFRRKMSSLCLIFELAKLVARDPVLFLHPTKGHAFSSCCGCRCVFSGNQWFEYDNNHNMSTANEINTPSPQSIGKQSPQRSTWEMSDDDNDDLEMTAASR